MDDIDQQLINALRRNSRTPLKVLGAAVKLSASAVQARIARLERDGVIAAFSIQLAEDQVAARAIMLVKTQAQSCAAVAPLISHIGEVQSADSVAGDVDLILRVAARSHDRLQAIRDEIAEVDGVVSVTTYPVLTTRFSR